MAHFLRHAAEQSGWQHARGRGGPSPPDQHWPSLSSLRISSAGSPLLITHLWGVQPSDFAFSTARSITPWPASAILSGLGADFHRAGTDRDRGGFELRGMNQMDLGPIFVCQITRDFQSVTGCVGTVNCNHNSLKHHNPLSSLTGATGAATTAIHSFMRRSAVLATDASAGTINTIGGANSSVCPHLSHIPTWIGDISTPPEPTHRCAYSRYREETSRPR